MPEDVTFSFSCCLMSHHINTAIRRQVLNEEYAHKVLEEESTEKYLQGQH